MRLAFREFQRICTRKWIFLWFLLLLFLGIWTSELWTQKQYQQVYCSLEDYLAVAEQYEGLPLDMAAEELQGRQESAEQLNILYASYYVGAMSEEEVNETLQAMGFEGMTISDIDLEMLDVTRISVRQVLEKVTILSEYDRQLSDLQKGFSGLSGISLFQEDIYVVRTRDKSMRDYKNLEVSVDVWHHNTTARTFLKDRSLDVFVFLFLLTVVLLLFTDEREKGYSLLTSTTAKGRQSFWFSKLTVMFVCTLGTVIIYECVLLGFRMYRSGPVIWNVPIQSIADFTTCRLELTVGQAMFFVVLLKILFMYVLTAGIAMLGCLCRKNISLLGGCAAAGFLSAVWLLQSNVNSYMGWLICLNPLYFLDTTEFLLGYQNFNIFQYPVDRIWITGTLAAVGLLGFSLAGSFLYGRVRQAAARRTPFRGRVWGARQQLAVGRKGINRRKPLIVLELRKLLLSGRLALPLLTVAVGALAYYLTAPEIGMSQEEMAYREYMWQLNGPLTEEKEQFLEQERRFFEQLEFLRQEALRQGNQELLLNYIDSMMDRRQAFSRVEEHDARIAASEAEVFLYETGYQYLLGSREDGRSSDGVLAAALMLALLTPYFCWMEYRRGAAELVRTAARGRWQLMGSQYAAYCLLALLVASGIYLGDTIRILQQFGGYGWNQRVDNFADALGRFRNWPIGGVLALVQLFRMAGVALVVLLAVALMKLCRDYLKTVLLCGILIVLPCVLYLLGISLFRGYFLNVLLWGNVAVQMISNGETGLLLAVLLQGGLCLWAAVTVIRKEMER